jgi:hypothetical protein
MLTYLWFNVTKLSATTKLYVVSSWRRARQPEKPTLAATAANWTTVRLSSGISANILDFGVPQKHVVRDRLAMESTGEAGVGEGQA